MRLRTALAVFVGATLISAGAFAACPIPPAHPKEPKEHVKAHKPPAGCVDLSGLPQVSEHIIDAEPTAAPVKTSAPSAPIEPNKPGYNGLNVGGLDVGLTKPDPGVRPTPTVGYHWSLD